MNKTKNIIRIMWITFLSGVTFLTLIFLLIGFGVFGTIPTFDELENPKSNLASQLYSADNKLLGDFFIEDRSMVEYSELSKNLEAALIATEDVRFKKHPGIDFIGLGRVAIGIITGNRKGGGSTISQQLAKNLFRMREESSLESSSYMEKLGKKVPFVKFKEWITAVRLEKNYTKEEILTMYLNTVKYGNQTFGIKSAAKTYFNKLPLNLNIQESALLVGLLKGPTKFNPRRRPENAKDRRNTVLKQMLKYKYITQMEFDSIWPMAIELDFKVNNQNEGIAQYFRGFIRTTLSKKEPKKDRYLNINSYREDSLLWATNPILGWCNKNKKPDGSNYDLYRDGLQIFSTVDSRMQRYAENAIVKHLSETLQNDFDDQKNMNPNFPYSYKSNEEEVERSILRSIKRSKRYWTIRKLPIDTILSRFDIPAKMKIFTWKGERDTIMSPKDSILHYKRFMHSALLSMDPHNAHVKAYVGGINHKYFKYDQVKSGRRLVGSTFKPFLYTLAMREGLDPCTRVHNVSVVFDMGDDEPYSPRYSKSKRNGQMITLGYGLANSLNQVSAWIMKRFGPKAVVKIAHQMGIKVSLPQVNSLCVGTAEIPLKELIAAYCTIGNKGIYTDPVFITRIEDKLGNVLAEFSPISREAIDEYTAYKSLLLMKNVPDRGTAARLRWKYDIRTPIAGKTGTTNNCADGWFIGLTPDLITGVWTGGEEQSISFRDGSKGQGAHMALPVWAHYMKSIYRDSTLTISQGDFEKPKNYNIEFDCEKTRFDEDMISSPTPTENKEEGESKENTTYTDSDDDLM